MCATSKITAIAFTILIVQHIGSTVPTSLPITVVHRPDPEMLVYLEQVFEDAKSLARPLVLGELNLLPSDMDGFANTVRCFFDINQLMSDDFRILKFNLSSLSLLDEIAVVQLVLKRPSSTTSTYTSHLYEIIGESTKPVDLLDSGEYSGQWHTLQVQVQNIKDSINNADNLHRNFLLALRITTADGEPMRAQDILRNIKPMLLVYTNSLDRLDNEMKLEIERKEAERREEKNREGSWQKRNTHQDVNTATPSLEDMKQLSCRKQATASLNLRLYTTYNLTQPTALNFTFCYGTCTDPSRADNARLYDNHAKIVAMADLSLSQRRISPCCIPNDMTTIRVIYQSNNAVILTSYPIVVSCRCM